MTTIMLADDHGVVRQALRSLLEKEQDFKVIGEADDGLEAVRRTESLHPDVLVVDIGLNGISGIEVTQQVSKRCPATNVVILSMHSSESYVLAGLKAGAKAYVLKECESDELIRAIREAAKGHRYLSTALSERAIDAYAHTVSPEDDPLAMLTTREREVLHLSAKGYSNAEVGEKLFISRRTAELHRSKMMRKLSLRTQTDLIRYAIKQGLLYPEDASDEAANIVSLK